MDWATVRAIFSQTHLVILTIKLVFREKRQYFRQKLAKIAENCIHNIDP
jgi:hypothetical protein